MVWFNLKVMEHIAKYTPLKEKEKKLEYCDENGNKLKYISGKYEKGYYEDENGNRVENAFILKDNKPFLKYDKTKEVNKIKEVDLSETEDLIVKHKYLMYSDSLLKEIKGKDKAYKFLFSNGGKDFYYAYVYESKLYQGFLFMILGKAYISDSVKPIIENMKEQKKAEELNLTIQGIAKLNLNEIEL